MRLQPGARFGPYQVVEPLGAGAMGEVYRARDTRLHRDVALKVLPERHRFDAARRARFEREAQALAALNHPNIATLHGIEDADGAVSGRRIRAASTTSPSASQAKRSSM